MGPPGPGGLHPGRDRPRHTPQPVPLKVQAPQGRVLDRRQHLVGVVDVAGHGPVRVGHGCAQPVRVIGPPDGLVPAAAGDQVSHGVPGQGVRAAAGARGAPGPPGYVPHDAGDGLRPGVLPDGVASLVLQPAGWSADDSFQAPGAPVGPVQDPGGVRAAGHASGRVVRVAGGAPHLVRHRPHTAHGVIGAGAPAPGRVDHRHPVAHPVVLEARDRPQGVGHRHELSGVVVGEPAQPVPGVAHRGDAPALVVGEPGGAPARFHPAGDPPAHVEGCGHLLPIGPGLTHQAGVGVVTHLVAAPTRGDRRHPPAQVVVLVGERRPRRLGHAHHATRGVALQARAPAVLIDALDHTTARVTHQRRGGAVRVDRPHHATQGVPGGTDLRVGVARQRGQAQRPGLEVLDHTRGVHRPGQVPIGRVLQDRPRSCRVRHGTQPRQRVPPELPGRPVRQCRTGLEPQVVIDR